MSEVPDTSYLCCIPTTSSLLYLLGGFACEWQEIGRQLNISECKLKEISSHVGVSDHRKIMKKMFDGWLLRGEACDWFAIQKVLMAIGEEDIAESLSQYIQQPQSAEFTSMEQSYQDRWLKTFKYETSRLDSLFDPTLRNATEDIADILSNEKDLWFKLGTALEVPQVELDKIKTPPAKEDDSVKLSRVLKTWTELEEENSWQKLISTLNELGYNEAAKSIQQKAWAIIRVAKEEERREDPTMEHRFLQYRRCGPGSLVKLSENQEYKNLKRDMMEYFDLENIPDTDLLKELTKYDIVEEYMIKKLNKIQDLCTETVREIEDDNNIAKGILTTLTDKLHAENKPEENWLKLQEELQHFGIDDNKRRAIRLMTFESGKQRVRKLLERQIERTDVNHSAICDSLNKLQEWRRQLHELTSTKTKLLQMYTTPTVNRLYYVLRELISDWRGMGQHFNVPETKLNQIAADNPGKSYRCMIEMLHYWVANSDECTWEAVEKVLKAMNETNLAETVHHYTAEMIRIQHRQRTHSGNCTKLVPLKDQCYKDWWLKQWRFECDPLSLLHDPTMKTSNIARCLQERAAEWDELGIALEMSRGKLCIINDDNEGSLRKLQEMIQTWLDDDLDHSWRKLINALSELSWGEVAKEVEEMARKLKHKVREEEAKEKDRIRSSSQNVAQLSSKLATRELRRADFKSRASESENNIKKKERELATKLPNMENLGNIMEHSAKCVHEHKIEHQDMMNVEQSRNEYIETLIQARKEDREMAEYYKQTLQEVLGDQREVVQEKQKLEEFRDKIQSQIEELDTQINSLGRSQRTPQNKLSLLEKLSSDKKILHNKLGPVNTSLSECMRLLTSIQRDRATISRELTQCADKLQACCDLLQENMKYTQEFKIGMPKQWEEYHRDSILDTSMRVAFASFFTAVTSVFLAPPLVPIAVGVYVASWTVGFIRQLTYTPKIHTEDYHAIVETCDRNTSELETEMKLIMDMKETIQRLDMNIAS